MSSRNPFELVTARRKRSVSGESVGPDLPVVEVGGFEYVVEPDGRVQAPDLPLRPDEWGPGTGAEMEAMMTSSRFPVRDKPLSDVLTERNEVPEVLFREAVRACLRKGVDPDKMRDIWELEIVDSVMES